MDQYMMTGTAGRFLNNARLQTMRRRSAAQKVWAWIITGFAAIVGGGILRKDTTWAEFREDLSFVIFLFALAGVLFLLSSRNKRRMALAVDCASRFPPGGGSIGISQLAEQVGRPADKLYLDLTWMFKKTVFFNCQFQPDAKEPTILVYSTEPARFAPIFVRVQCPHCNGLTQAPLGGMGKCEWCDAPVRGDSQS